MAIVELSSEMFRTKGTKGHRNWRKQKFWLLNGVFFSPTSEPDLPTTILWGLKAEGWLWFQADATWTAGILAGKREVESVKKSALDITLM